MVRYFYVGDNKTVHTPPKNLDEVKDFVLEAFNSLAERDIYTGDGVELMIITPQGTTLETFPLRRD